MNTIEKEQRKQLLDIIIKEYLNTPELERSLTKLGDKYGIKRQIIAKELKNRGYEVINYQNRLRVQEDIFDNIDTEEKAYWLGFLYADGNISRDQHKIEMNLSIKDVDHMIKFKEFLKLENEIRIRKNYGRGDLQCRLSFRNSRIWNNLNDKGCVPCKSLILTFPDISIFSNKNLVYDFIRGYVDGDGCLYICKTRNTIDTEVSLVGTENFLNGVKQFLGINGSIRNKSTRNYTNRAYQLRYSTANARKVARLLYENSTIYLDRKYNKFLEFCQIEENSSKRKSSKISRNLDDNTELI